MLTKEQLLKSAQLRLLALIELALVAFFSWLDDYQFLSVAVAETVSSLATASCHWKAITFVAPVDQAEDHASSNKSLQS